MILAVDVQYDERTHSGCVGGVLFEGWADRVASQTLTTIERHVGPYVSGEFYRRELPCLLPLVRRAVADHNASTIVVDGFVDLGAGRPGLGRHLFDALAGKVTVVGVAKNPFAGSTALTVNRGKSKRALWVTSTGDRAAAARDIAAMAGDYRIPTLLKLADALSRATAADA